MLRQLKETHANMNQVMLDAIAMAQRVFTPEEPAPEPDRVRDRRARPI